MAGYLILFAFILCGLGASFALFREKSPLIRIWIGCCMGLMMMMCLPPAWAFLFNFTRTAQLLGLGTAMAIAGGCIFFTRKRRSENASFSGDMPLWLLCITLPLIILSAYLMYTHYLRNVDGALHVGQSTYGDLSLHLGIAASLRNAKFPPDYSILPGTLLGYPFFSDSMLIYIASGHILRPLNLPFVGLHLAGHDAHEGGFPFTIGSNQTDMLSL